MSGGTDSSVAALLLQDAGYEVTGVTFRFYEKEGDTEYLDDARTLCERLKIKHISYDVRNMFRETIIDYFIREYTLLSQIQMFSPLFVHLQNIH